MSEHRPPEIPRHISTGKLLAFVCRVDSRKLPEHAKAVDRALIERAREWKRAA